MPAAGFPWLGYGINRFTSTISVSVPAGYTADRQWKADDRSDSAN